ncbi:hypothetical protein Scep_030303 [Stephania cephalantha]|uniref:Methylcrotonoyl-CoA carboxylase subunit alpha BT domain-containing protein n=1 Tax=Stephania cephalantha TaxID=152367 RepID=A0AAP0HGD2_9MAGN
MEEPYLPLFIFLDCVEYFYLTYLACYSMAGSNNLNSLWLAHPPFRVHHDASETMELKWDNEDASDSKKIKLSVTQQSNGNYLVKIADSNSSRHEVKVTPLGQNDFRTEIDGLSIDINVAVYNKDYNKHIHV